LKGAVGNSKGLSQDGSSFVISDLTPPIASITFYNLSVLYTKRRDTKRERNGEGERERDRFCIEIRNRHYQASFLIRKKKMIPFQ
jgi:hypothetical protein